MPPEAEPFLVAVVLALAAAWAAALRVMLRIGSRGQPIGACGASALVVGGALGFCALVVLDATRPPRAITGTVESVGDPGESRGLASDVVVIDGRTYGVRRRDLEKLQVGEKVRGQTGALFDFLQRVDAAP